MSNIMDVPMADIILDPRLRMRANLDDAAIEEYAESIFDLPPAKIVMDDGGLMYLTWGWHRYHAHAKAKQDKMKCEVRKGTFLDALAEAAGGNHGHGVRRSDADKRVAVLALLATELWQGRSDRMVADTCKVSHDFVGKIRAENEASDSQSQSGEGDASSGDDATRNSGNGKTKKRADKRGRSQPATKQKVLCKDCLYRQSLSKPLIENCEACAKLRKKAKADKKRKEEEAKTDDGLPKSVSNALADTWHAECARLCSKIRTECKGAFSWSSWLDAAVLDHLKAAEDCFNTAIPRKICPDCKGQKVVDKVPCATCRQGGYLASQV